MDGMDKMLGARLYQQAEAGKDQETNHASLPDLENLNERLAFLELDQNASEVLRASKKVLMQAMPDVLEHFYVKLRAEPQVAKFFSGEGMIATAKEKQKQHWDHVTDGHLDETYLDAVLRVGKIHEHIGLEPHWYMSGYAFILEQLTTALVKAHWPQKRFGRQPKGQEQLTEQMSVLVRTAILDMELTISVYLATLNMHSQEQEEKNRAITSLVITTMKEVTDKLSYGDLTCRIGDEFPAEYTELRQRFNIALDKLTDTMNSLHENAAHVHLAVKEISAASEDMSCRTESQAASLEQSNAALNEMTEAIRQTSKGIERLNESVAAANKNAENVKNVVNEAGVSMEQINESSRKIFDIIGVIDEIAFQTNLLALNAGVEAARAGDAGRGFAVVATEVRALAQRSAKAAKEIKDLIQNSGEKVKLGVDLVKKSGDGLKDILKNIEEINGLSGTIAENSRGQTLGLAQVNEAMNAMGQDVQKNAAMAEQVNASIHQFENEVEQLNNTVGAFKL